MTPPRRLTVACDMDGILANFLDDWLYKVWDRHAVGLEVEEIKDWDLKAHPKLKPFRKQIDDIINTPWFFRNLSVINGARNGIDRLLSWGHDVTILTAAKMRDEESSARVRDEKTKWLRDYFPSIKNIVFTTAATKHEFKADVYIEDRPDTLLRMAEANPKALVTGIIWPYNTSVVGSLPLAAGWNNTTQAWIEICAKIYHHSKLSPGESS